MIADAGVDGAAGGAAGGAGLDAAADADADVEVTPCVRPGQACDGIVLNCCEGACAAEGTCPVYEE